MIEERYINSFWKKVNKGENCWEWTACLSESGYGILGIGNGKTDRAHRFSFRIHRGEIPKGMFVCHTCDNRKCVNPDHLFVGTNLDNVRDMHAKSRAVKPPPMAGWNKYEYSEEIISLLGKLPDAQIARMAKVSKYAIAYERRRQGIEPFPCPTRFKKGDPHPRWSRERRCK